MLSIHTNYTSLLTQNNLNKTSGAMDNAMQRISTGFRINSAADDAAGLQIATRLQSQVNGLGVAQRNAQDATSMMQTAEGAFDEMTNIGHRMKDLATQAANGTNSADEHDAMQAEWNQLAAELDSVIENTQFGSGNNLFAAGGQFDGAVTFQIGSSTSETLTVDISDGLGDIRAAIGVLAAADLSTEATVDVDGNVTDPSGAAKAMDAVDALLNGTPESAQGADDATAGIGAIRSELGANINRLDHTITNLGNMSENTEMAKGRIMDTDYAVESSNMMKNQMLTQMSMSMLSQANGMSGMVMSLVG
ncbi:lateral flagellin LafA [Photobacterium lutimaris]|uniref:Flagellin n=1 Tax=Photobacterium lutimaris TaxID=388278 RepID=A0A2T3IV74_9GAMM|nr:lateral flagellin LafA [Photobacterium lutimaris]PSU32307.1 Lateral flagellin [Photobacterium lutimaris]TDR73180.1 flagellin [Photobacterium lutimaris]